MSTIDRQFKAGEGSMAEILVVPETDIGDGEEPYKLKISRLTVDKLGVKLYDKASAVVAELVSNGYDADAENVFVEIPLSSALATHTAAGVTQGNYTIEVRDDGHGMTPEEARLFYLRVGADRRRNMPKGERSRYKLRPVMGRKGIGKLAPFGICRRIEVRSAGGVKTDKGYLVTHFFMDFERIVSDSDDDVVLDKGPDDRTWDETSGTRIRLSNYLPKRVPDSETFMRQLAVRFTFAQPDFNIYIRDLRTNQAAPGSRVARTDIPLMLNTRIDLSGRPVIGPDGSPLPVKGWIGMAREAYKNEEMMGVRIYARGKIVGMTRDFNLSAGFTGEFAARSYLVGEIEAEWLDLDDGEDLVRTDRQDILWDSEYGQVLRTWGAALIREVARASREPRREKVRTNFLERSEIERMAVARFGEKSDVVDAALDLARKFGGLAAEDELNDEVYVNDLTEIILSVAPHQALIEAFQEFNSKINKGQNGLAQLLDIFDKSQVAELASYAQVASERVKIINELEGLVTQDVPESTFQNLISKATWLIEPTWSVITKNQYLRTFRDQFQLFWKKKTGEEVQLAIDHETKRPDFTLVNFGQSLRIVEIKKPGHDFDLADFKRLINYVQAFEEFFELHKQFEQEFSKGWQIVLVADGEDIGDFAMRKLYSNLVREERVVRISWLDFLLRAKKSHEQFLDIQAQSLKGKDAD